MILGSGSKSYWLGLGASTGVGSTFCLGTGGRFCCCSPSWSLKVLCPRCWSTHVTCAPALAGIALDLLLIIPPGLILIASGCIIIAVIALPLGPWAVAAGILIVISLISVGSLLLAFLWCTFSPYNNCHQLLLHLNLLCPGLLSRGLGVRNGISLMAHEDITNHTRLRSTGVIMLLLFVFVFSLSSCLHQSHVIIYGIVKFGLDHLLEGFPKTMEQLIPNISSCFCLRDSLQMLNSNFIQLTL